MTLNSFERGQTLGQHVCDTAVHDRNFRWHSSVVLGIETIGFAEFNSS